ncbi:hypothetical protein BCR39DRAFT_505099 [Naematelia encephala]|uniref:Uncharacterized protein n=1 Tax=Naematelia encephala TaxID=71784 RepID=A0A1Y2B6W6_9TREE|nr:hypothetical protein BCR39DRAFT_505099 [Naematelia encephala]
MNTSACDCQDSLNSILKIPAFIFIALLLYPRWIQGFQDDVLQLFPDLRWTLSDYAIDVIWGVAGAIFALVGGITAAAPSMKHQAVAASEMRCLVIIGNIMLAEGIILSAFAPIQAIRDFIRDLDPSNFVWIPRRESAWNHASVWVQTFKFVLLLMLAIFWFAAWTIRGVWNVIMGLSNWVCRPMRRPAS